MRAFVIILALLAYLGCSVAPVFASDKDEYSSNALRITTVNWLFSSTLEADVYGVMSPEDLAKIRRVHVTAVSAEDGSDNRVFETPKLFKHLTEVLLMKEQNAEPLITAARNYPGIKLLVIGQQYKHKTPKEPLSFHAQQQLLRFRKLKEMQLSGALEEPGKFGDVLPASLRGIILIKTNVAEPSNPKPLKLPRLRDLQITQSRVNKEFLGQLDAPNLSTVSFLHDELGPGTISKLSKFHKLKEITLYKSGVSNDNRELKTLLIAFPKLLVSFK